MSLIQDEGTTVFEGFITGISHHDYAKHRNSIRPGDLCVVKPVKNDYDSDALGVFYCNQQIGWIPKNSKGNLPELFKHPSISNGTDARIIYHRTLMPSRGDTHYQECIKIRLRLDDKVFPSQTQREDVQQVKQSIKHIEKKEEIKMTKLANAINTNKTAATLAAQLEAGRLANKHVTKLISTKLPMIVRGYADTTLARLALANAVSFAVDNYGQKFGKHKELIAQISDAMVISAYTEIIAEFDLEGMIQQFLEGKDMKKISVLLKTAEAEEEKE